MIPPLFMGIDGGGSGLRVLLAEETLAVYGESRGPAVNPSTIGRERAAQIIQGAMRAALGDLSPERVAAVGIGIAGAAASHSAPWLIKVVRGVLPEALVVPSADYDIALVGAVGERQGVLILAGTGSLVYGVNASGESLLLGGWGYLLGDEGSGYWLGLEGLRAVTAAEEGLSPPTALRALLFGALGIKTARDLIPRLYGEVAPPVRLIAQLAPHVLAAAHEGDMMAQAIAKRGAERLAQMARHAMCQLGLISPNIAFAGGVLSEPNFLSEALQHQLGLQVFPRPLYPPAMGAILLAREAFRRYKEGKGV